MKITRLVRCSVLALAVLAISASSVAGVFVSVNIAPPVLPVYTQPACPGDGYIWTPGYWAYGPDGYYWVPGTWVVAPEPGFLWTPGYWAFSGGGYLWHAGYWGPHIGFYGGVNYGFGYFGEGYEGGYWRGRTFYYNRSVNNIRISNVHIYNRTVVIHERSRVAFNGPGGINRRPSRDDQRFMHERHFEATHMQVEHEHGARGNREFLASVNHGRPAILATSRPGEFRGHNAAQTRPVADHRMDNRAVERRMDNRADRRMDNRADQRMDNRAMNREVARPQNNGRNMDRPMPRENASNNRGGQPHNNMRSANPAPQNRGAAPRRENRQHESAPHPQKESRGPKGR
ncbi:MAG: YXWGXW repeat-containing protein [Terriglobales bacterium]